MSTFRKEISLLVTFCAIFLLFHVPALAQGPISAGIIPVESITATGNAGFIRSVTFSGATYYVLSNDLVTGVSTRYDSSGNVYTAGSYPSGNADNFDMAIMTSLDSCHHIKTMFSEPATTFVVFENGGNDNAEAQALDLAGNLIGTAVNILANSADYGVTGFKSGIGNQSVEGFVFTTDTPAYGIRIVGPGFDPISVSAVKGSVIDIAPSIVSSPVVTAITGEIYSYDVQATGTPEPTYSLTVFPSGMTINSTTGLIEWTPDQTQLGMHSITVMASNSEGSDQQTFDIEVTVPPPAGIIPITAITADGVSGANPINLLSITVGTYTVTVDQLRTGTGSGTYTGSGTPSHPVENADNFNIYSLASQFDPHLIVNFGGALFTDENGDNPDFFIFESGGDDIGTIQAIFPDDTLGNTISFSNASFGDTGFNSAYNDIKGFAFEIRDLLDASGNNLTNSSVIKGLRINSANLDPGCICAVTSGMVPEVPMITSVPVLDAYIGQAYIYDIEASGVPAPEYQLLNGPAGMDVNSVTGILQWTPSAGQFGLNNVEIIASNSEGRDPQSFSIDVQETPLCPSNFIHYWTLDEVVSGNYTDLIGGSDANCISCPVSTDGMVGLAQEFDGSSNYLSAIAANYPTDAITVMAWINAYDLSQTGPDECIISRDDVFELSIEENGDRISWVVVDGVGAYNEYEPVMGANIIEEGVWTHIAATFDGTKQAIYINGNLIGETFTSIESLASLSNPYLIGYSNIWEPRFFDGAIDEVAVFDVALGEAIIYEMYEKGLMGKKYCNEQPVFENPELISIDGNVLIKGELETGFKLMLNGEDQLYELNLGTQTTTNNSLLQVDSGPVYFGFRLSEPNSILAAYFESKHDGMPYKDELLAIANAQSPIFYIKVQDIGGVETFSLIDGFMLDTEVLTPSETYLRINGDYPQVKYEFIGAIDDENGVGNIITFTMSVCHDTDSDTICDLEECAKTNLDGIGNINFIDFAILAQNWLQSGSGLAGDIDENGTVEELDLAQIAQHWLSNCQ